MRHLKLRGFSKYLIMSSLHVIRNSFDLFGIDMRISREPGPVILGQFSENEGVSSGDFSSDFYWDSWPQFLQESHEKGQSESHKDFLEELEKMNEIYE